MTKINSGEDKQEKPPESQSSKEAEMEMFIELIARVFLQHALWKQNKKKGDEKGDLLP